MSANWNAVPSGIASQTPWTPRARPSAQASGICAAAASRVIRNMADARPVAKQHAGEGDHPGQQRQIGGEVTQEDHAGVHDGGVGGEEPQQRLRC